MNKEEAYKIAIVKYIIETMQSYKRVALTGRGIENGWVSANTIRQLIQENGGYDNKKTPQEIFFDYDGRLAIKILTSECKKINFSVVRSDGKKRINYKNCSYQVNIQPNDDDLFETLAHITKPPL
jgi:hypothetical protein